MNTPEEGLRRLQDDLARRIERGGPDRSAREADADATPPDSSPESRNVDAQIAATLAAGIMATGVSGYPATPQGALELYRAVLAEMEKG